MSTLYTIGHSNRTLEEFIEILKAHHIERIIDIRTIPKSRSFPWFNQSELSKSLRNKHIAYKHMKNLGGLRHAAKDSINQGWHNASFRGFADYMQTPEFFAGLKSLNELLKSDKKTAIMCAEAVPWRCHRSLIGDAEIVRGVKVLDILSRTSVRPHELTSFAVVDRGKRPIKVYYPSSQMSLIS